MLAGSMRQCSSDEIWELWTAPTTHKVLCRKPFETYSTDIAGAQRISRYVLPNRPSSRYARAAHSLVEQPPPADGDVLRPDYRHPVRGRAPTRGYDDRPREPARGGGRN